MGISYTFVSRKAKAKSRAGDTWGEDMGLTNWLEIYRSYTGEELAAEITSLRKSLAGGFASQGSGSVQHEKDLSQLEARLQAATRVRNERSGGGNTRVAQVDFSDSRSCDF